MTAGPENKPAGAAAQDEQWRELLHLHRKAVLQADSDISDRFEIKLRQYREMLLAGSQHEGPVTPDAVLDYAGMHGLISPRRQNWQWSQVFNQKLIGFVRSVLAAAARAGADASLAAPEGAKALLPTRGAVAWCLVNGRGEVQTWCQTYWFDPTGGGVDCIRTDSDKHKPDEAPFSWQPLTRDAGAGESGERDVKHAVLAVSRLRDEIKQSLDVIDKRNGGPCGATEAIHDKADAIMPIVRSALSRKQSGGESDV